MMKVASLEIWLHLEVICVFGTTFYNTISRHPFTGPFSGTTRVSRYQKVKTNLDFTEARDSEWQWHELGHMQVCNSLQTDNHASTPPLSFYLAMLCIRGTSHGPVSVRMSVRLSVTSQSYTKTDRRRITQTTPHDSPGTLVF